MKEANKIKTAYEKVYSHAEKLRELIKAEGDMKWANNPENLGPLEQAIDEVAGTITACPFISTFLVMDTAKLKKAYTADRLCAGLSDVIKLKTPIDTLGNKAKKLMRMHHVS